MNRLTRNVFAFVIGLAFSVVFFSSLASSAPAGAHPNYTAVAVWVDKDRHQLASVDFAGFDTLKECTTTLVAFVKSIRERGLTEEALSQVEGAVDVVFGCRANGTEL